MRQYADLTYDARHPYRLRENIAEHLARNVCLCENPGGLKPSKVLPTAWVCQDCGNFPVYFVYKCIICEEEFLHDFIANFCYTDPCCWECNQQNEPCKDHIYCVTFIQDANMVPPAVTLKPAFTAEQLANVFSFPSPTYPT